MTPAVRHFAILAPPLPGHLNPMQVLAAELISLGHRVTVVHIGGAARFVTEAAVGFAPLPDSVGGVGALESYLETLSRPTGFSRFSAMIRATAAMTEALLTGAPAVLERLGVDAVIVDPVEPAGALIARRIGVPCVAAVTGLPLLGEDDVPPPFVGWRYRPDALGRFRNRVGYAVVNRLMRPILQVVDARQRQWGLAGSAPAPLLHVAQCPRGLDYPRRALPSRFFYGAPWRRAEAEDPGLPEDGRPLVFCSLGTLQGSWFDLFRTMSQACAEIGARAVIGHGGGLSPAEVASLPGEPLVRAFWPQAAVLRRCVAAVLHGGFNTVLDALAAGVPIVALPIAFEQPATAARIARVGAGRVVSPSGLRARELAVALDDVVRRPGYRNSARRLAAEMRQAGGAAEAAATINGALARSA